MTFGLSDTDIFATGPTCGGELVVLISRVGSSSPMRSVIESIATDEPVTVATALAGPETGARLGIWRARTAGTLGTDATDREAREIAVSRPATVRPWRELHVVRECPILLEHHPSRPRMLVFGACGFAAALSRIGSLIGHRVTVCDPRPVFATPARFPHADEVVCAWPHEFVRNVDVDERTVVCVLLHNLELEIPLLAAVADISAGYIGVMGSRRTHHKRVAALREAGVDDDHIARLAFPIGLDLGARDEAGTAVAIAAEIVAAESGGTGLPLSTSTGPIHRRRASIVGE
ncbi:XdhC family protein [Nocardia gipuzkoensis]